MGKCTVKITDEFAEWWLLLLQSERKSIAARVEILEEQGVELGHPYTSKIQSSRHGRMRELRIQSNGKPIRVFYVFDQHRTAILLIGDRKNNDRGFYKKLVPFADRLYDEHVLNPQRKEVKAWEVFVTGKS